MCIDLDLKEIERRANHAALQDGLVEILMGLFLIFYGGSLATDTISFGLVFVLLAVFLGKPTIERIKVRYIYPRAGYVKLPPDPDTTGKGIAISAVIMVVVLLGAFGLSMAILGQKPGLDFFLTYIVPPVSGLMLAIGPYWLGQTYGLVRGYILAILFLLGGIAMPVFGIASGYQAVGLLCSVMGAVAALMGTVLFVRFIRRNPAQPFEGQEATDA